jgi:glycosyltransferase involved in cell wall biosynthesis
MAADAPLFSICIPQFNRTSFLLRSLERLHNQTAGNFEVCISDGHSTDGRSQELVSYLQQSSLPHKCHFQEEPTPYDRNLRAAIALASGRYCFLLGNDDLLATNATLEQVGTTVRAHDFPEVVVANYHELSSGCDFRRVGQTCLIGQGVEAAIANFRNYSFVSGVLLDRQLAQEYATDKWDGSEMYQTFLASRIVAGGGRLFGIAETIVLKDIQIEGERVDSYARRDRVENCRICERVLPLSRLGQVVVDGISPGVSNVNGAMRRIFRQLLLFTYPPWLIEYRRIQSWRYAMGIALGMRPRNILGGLQANWPTRIYIHAIYIVATIGGLIFPIRLFERLKPRLHIFAKRR